ncbi:MAG: hypothetical protein FWB93_00620 [Oscillospiraceae bacterium]|nr:hypothetical protein [Oscillospiraceae bacterium]
MSKKRLIINISAIITALAIVTCGVAIYLSFADSLAVRRAARNFVTELSERTDNSIVGKFDIIQTALSDGAIYIDFSAPTSSDNLAIYRNASRREAAVLAERTIDNIRSYFNLFANTDMFTIQSSIFDSEHYQIYFSNFADDFAPIGERFSMNEEDVFALANWAEVASASPVNLRRLARPYLRTAVRHLRRNESAVTLRHSQSDESFRRISYNFNGNELAAFLGDIHARMERDNNLRPLIGIMGASAYDNTLAWLNNLSLSAEEGSGLSINFSIGNRNRLLRFELTFGEFHLAVNTGTSPTDTWEINITTESTTARLYWSINDESTIRTSLFQLQYNRTRIDLTLAKNKDSGEFTLSIGREIWNVPILRGKVTAEDATFAFEASLGSIRISVSAQVGVPVPQE